MIRRSGGTLRVAWCGVVAVLVLLAGCSSDASEGAATSSDPSTTESAPPATSVPGPAGSGVAPEGFGSVSLVVTRADGTVEELCVWLADSEALRQRGLMGVTDPTLGGAGAMVFAFDADTAGSFWMKDTLLPLSIAWFTADGSYVASADMEPCPEDVADCPTYGPGGRYRYAVEVALGGLDDLGLVDGSTVALGSGCGVGSQAA